MTTLQRTAIVVGVGSEQGLGAAIARRFAAEGQRVIVSGRTEAKIARVVRAIVDSGGKAEAFTVDATIESEVVAPFDFAGASDHLMDSWCAMQATTTAASMAKSSTRLHPSGSNVAPMDC